MYMRIHFLFIQILLLLFYSQFFDFIYADLAKGSADIVIGQTDFSHNDANFVDGRGFAAPYGIAIDNITNRIYVSDIYNNRILWWYPMAELS